MIGFTDFYLTEAKEKLIVDFNKEVFKRSELPVDLYEFAKTYLKRSNFKVNNKTFVTQRYQVGDIIGVRYLKL
jgi:hypothetical protein